MRQFEVGKVYSHGGLHFEVLKHSAKSLTIQEIHHPGRYNESRRDPERIKVQEWPEREVVYFHGAYTIEA